MCDPVSIGLVVTTVASTYAAKKSADAQTSALGAQAPERANQISEAGSAQLGIRARQARVDQGRAEVAGGEAGVRGNSYEANLGNISQQQKTDSGTIETNVSNQQLSNQTDTNAVFSRIKQPDYLSAALSIGGDAENSSYMKDQRTASGNPNQLLPTSW